jgi:hypothetical protein
MNTIDLRRSLYAGISCAVAISFVAPGQPWFVALFWFVVVFGGVWILLEKFGPKVLFLGFLLYLGAGSMCVVQTSTGAIEPRPVMDHVCAHIAFHVFSRH